jgi:hypothetical protein
LGPLKKLPHRLLLLLPLLLLPLLLLLLLLPLLTSEATCACSASS